MSELAARVRAARGYKGVTQKQLADAIGIDVQSIKRTEGGRRDPKEPELRAIAAETGVPRSFFEVGFDDLVRDDDSDAEAVDRITDHDERMDQLAKTQLALMQDMSRRIQTVESLLQTLVAAATPLGGAEDDAAQTLERWRLQTEAPTAETSHGPARTEEG